MGDIAKAFGTDRAGALALINSVVEDGSDTSAFEAYGVGRTTLRSFSDMTVTGNGLSPHFVVLEPDTGTIVTAFPNPLGYLTTILGLSE